MYFLLSNQSWAHNPIFREAQGRRRGYTSFSTKIFLEKHRRYCPCFLLTPLNSYKRGTAKKSREKKSKVQKQSQTQLWFFFSGLKWRSPARSSHSKAKTGIWQTLCFLFGDELITPQLWHCWGVPYPLQTRLGWTCSGDGPKSSSVLQHAELWPQCLSSQSFQQTSQSRGRKSECNLCSSATAETQHRGWKSAGPGSWHLLNTYSGNRGCAAELTAPDLCLAPGKAHSHPQRLYFFNAIIWCILQQLWTISDTLKDSKHPWITACTLQLLCVVQSSIKSII